MAAGSCGFATFLLTFDLGLSLRGLDLTILGGVRGWFGKRRFRLRRFGFGHCRRGRFQHDTDHGQWLGLGFTGRFRFWYGSARILEHQQAMYNTNQHRDESNGNFTSPAESVGQGQRQLGQFPAWIFHKKQRHYAALGLVCLGGKPFRLPIWMHGVELVLLQGWPYAIVAL